jgi:diacylglycerol kinase family enzyme
MLVQQVAERLRGAGCTVTIDVAGSFESGRDMARRAADRENADAVVAAGGDSTVRGLAAGLIGSAMPLGVIPVGTGNVLGSELGLDRNAERLALGLMRDRVVPVRTGVANGHPFMLMASAGFDARVLGHLDQDLKRRIGKLAYAGPILRELKSVSRTFEAVIDGRVVSCSWLIVTRVARYGGPFLLAPEQSLIDDGLHAVVVKARTRLGLARTLIAIASGSVARLPNVEMVACSLVLVEASAGLMTQLDGEIFQSPPLDIHAGGSTLQLVVPDAYIERDRVRARAHTPLTR